MFLITGCSSDAALSKPLHENQYTSYLDDVDKESIAYANNIGDIAYNFLDPNVLYEKAEVIALVTINSIDSASTTVGTVTDPNGYTLGSLTPLKVYKGNVTADVIINFTRFTGVLPYSKYLDGIPPAMAEKLEKSRDKNSSVGQQYIDTTFEGDFQLTAGESYLVYKVYSEDLNSYTMIGFQAGALQLTQSIHNSKNVINEDIISIKDGHGNIAKLSTYLIENVLNK